MAPIYLVSDIHAGDPAGEAGRRDFLDFLCFLENQKGELFILGDLFDFWFEWRHVVPKGVFDILYQLRRLVDAGWRVVFLPGNHDFAPGAFLSQEVGIELPGESMVLEVEDKRYFLSHGDGLAARDRGYRVLKKILHSPLSQWLFRHFLHPDWGMGLARLSSHGSRRYCRIDREAWAKDYLEAARRYFLNGFDGVVLGHVHEPVMLREGDRVYANCGDWLEHRSCIVGEAGKLCIADWDPQRKHLQKRSPDVE